MVDRKTVRAWVVAVRDLDSRAAALEILREAGKAEKTAHIKPEHFSDVIQACQRLLDKTELPPFNNKDQALPYSEFPVNVISATQVEFVIQPDNGGHVIWINVDGKCLLHVQKTSQLIYSSKPEEI